MNKKKSQECEIVQDLLPLYYDDVCSPSSKKFVHQHLENCEICKNFYEELKNDSVDRIMEKETHDVLERHARKERTAAYKAGLIISVLLLIPIVITLLVSMAAGGGLGVFSVVAASMLLVAALDCRPAHGKTKQTDEKHSAGSNRIIADYIFCRQNERRRSVYLPCCSDCFRNFRTAVSFRNQRALFTACTF